MKKNSLIILLLVCIGVSCNQSDSPVKVSTTEEMATIVVNSPKFQGASVSTSELDMAHAIFKTSPSGKPGLIIPYKQNGSDNFVIAFFDDTKRNVQFTAVVNAVKETVAEHSEIFKQAPVSNPPGTPVPEPINDADLPSNDFGVTDITADPNGTAAAAFSQGTFNGFLKFTIPTQYVLNYHFLLSKPVSVATTVTGSDRCKGWTETGGPLDCAGKTISSQGPLATFDCYIVFMKCLAFAVGDCLWSGCQ